MFFLSLSKADIRFVEQKLVWRTYIAVGALPTTSRVETIDKKNSTVAALKVDNEIFVIHLVALVELITMPIHPSCQAQVVALTSKKNGFLIKYFDFSNVFSSDSAAELPEHTRVNNCPINLLDDKQLLCGPIYSLRLVELEMLKLISRST